jgi:hypothetical protein
MNIKYIKHIVQKENVKSALSHWFNTVILAPWQAEIRRIINPSEKLVRLPSQLKPGREVVCLSH